MTLASILVPGLIWGMLVLGLLVIAGVTARRHWRKLDAEREAALAPVRLLREQDELISDLLRQVTALTLDKDVLPARLYDRVRAVQDKYQEITKGKRKR